ncbi:MAG: hypothetical protein GF332_02700 [Candidatus Moranbacteria bacterium]|nr:hypothetical protein [Candidatus Moranbacteria bacterium]
MNNLEYPNIDLPGHNQEGNLIVDFVFSVLSLLLLVFGSFAIIAFTLSGILYLTSAGNQERIERAKRAMYYSIIGVIVGMGGYFVVTTINSLF